MREEFGGQRVVANGTLIFTTDCSADLHMRRVKWDLIDPPRREFESNDRETRVATEFQEIPKARRIETREFSSSNISCQRREKNVSDQLIFLSFIQLNCANTARTNKRLKWRRNFVEKIRIINFSSVIILLLSLLIFIKFR